MEARARRCDHEIVWRIVSLVPLLCALSGFSAGWVDSRILFARDPSVPRSVQEFAWRVVETRCNYQRYELAQRSFWAYDVRVKTVDADVVYSINILSELPWKKTEPPAVIAMTVVHDGGVRLAALTSSFVVCTP